jgi:CheY-like chemotaxis protein
MVPSYRKLLFTIAYGDHHWGLAGGSTASHPSTIKTCCTQCVLNSLETLTMTKRVLDIGQCNPDYSSISRLLNQHFDVEIVRAHLESDAVESLQAGSFDLVLVNRKLDRDYSDGLSIIRNIRSDEKLKQTSVMLVSNYPESQDEAVAAGAVYGFGKAELGSREVVERLAAILGSDAPT